MFEKDLNNITFNELIKLVDSFKQNDNNHLPVKIAFLRNITIDHVVTYLKYLCYKENIAVSAYMGDYDNIMQLAMDGNSYIYQKSFDIISICLKLETLSERLVVQFSSLSPSEITEECKCIIDFVDKIISEIRKHTTASIILHNFEIPVYPSFGILDYQDNYKQVNTVRRINRDLLDIVSKYESTFILDVDLLQATVGYLNFIDNRFWHIGKAPYTKEAYIIIAKEYLKFLLSLKGKNRKCLILDCDNTLWGGVIGEDGINNIKLGITYPGSAYREFQQTILNLYNRGIMLAICSKNNESDVIEVIETHPYMVLRGEHFVSMKINWKDKATNLKELSDELNIGMDSMVFIDDSDFEVQLVRKLLPEINTFQLPGEPSLYKDLLNSIGFFDTLVFSKEDSKRSKMYKAEMNRKKAMAEFQVANLEDYYRYLKMEIYIKTADDFSIPRIAQLTQRTNQFNLTTKRYSEAEIQDMTKLKDTDVLYLHLKDRFGDSGIVGLAILKYNGKGAYIDTFLLSCRVIGRHVEDVLLNACINTAINRGCERIIGFYKPTKKNGQVENFFIIHNFLTVDENKNGTKSVLHLKNSNHFKFPDFFNSIRVNNKSCH